MSAVNDPQDLAPDPSGMPEVLVVDDNPATRYSTARILRAAGFRTLEACTGGEALQRSHPGLAAVVLDVHLPDINGFEVCKALRARPETTHLPVVYLSAAYVDNEDKVRGLYSGADAYMTHPAEPSLLIATIQTLGRTRDAEDAMRSSEARFRAIYNQAVGGICLINTEGYFVEVNPAMLTMLGRQQPAVVGQRVVDLAPPEWAERISGYLSQHQQSMWRGEFPLLNAQGEQLHLAWSLSAHVEQGLTMAMATDISERIALTQQREQLLEREQAARVAAERISRSKDEFIAVLSHELRTPLNAILSWVHVLKHPEGVNNLTRGLNAIARNAETQRRLISDILDVSRMDLGKLRLELESVDVAELVSSAVTTLGALMRDKSLTAQVDVEQATRPLTADPSRLQQIIWNLLSNAIKFSEPGGQITVQLLQTDAELTLKVQDLGQGIKSEFLPYLFDRFTQSDSASNRYHGGLGLGLSIVKQLVELHGGTIRAASEGVGKGATFTVTLPTNPTTAFERTDSDHMPLVDESEVAEISIPPSSLNGLSIVIVDDDQEARDILCMILRDRGAEVVSADGYDEGLRFIHQARPHVLVSDIGMPGKDGHALIREVRRLEK
ncbi:response regulator [Aquabacterium sp.]|uniref:response regulator n=1 Tax=Aquabacterium sp. TaxID=1872578 RepID=UPI002489A794|nr:response regulator [Aquabacterium sp.]MDI1259118.1 response regulator [Aquabacterium sp.]